MYPDHILTNVVMFEVLEVVKDSNFSEKLLFIVLEDDVKYNRTFLKSKFLVSDMPRKQR